MAHVWYHAVSSARVFGGQPEDYTELHAWLDQSKEHFGSFQHRAMRHHAEGIFEGERKFGITIENSAGKRVPVRAVLEQHIIEDCGRIPTLSEWLEQIQPQPWMARHSMIRQHRTRRMETDCSVDADGEMTS